MRCPPPPATMLSSVKTLAEIWPPYGVSLIENDLKMTVITDEDIPGLVDLALGGIHEPDRMPFSTPWTAVEPELLPANMVRYYSSVRANFTPEMFELQFAVRIGGELVGTQGLHASDFAVTRTGETGSWLGRTFQGRGIGTRMRRAICAFAFDHSRSRGIDLFRIHRQRGITGGQRQARIPTQWPGPDGPWRRRGHCEPASGADARDLRSETADRGDRRRGVASLPEARVR